MFNKNYKNINSEEAYNLINSNEDMIILDVRTKEEFIDGHIPGAISIPVQKIDNILEDLDEFKDKPVLVYCASGGRSPHAVKALLNNDFSKVYHLNRGILSWKYEIKK